MNYSNQRQHAKRYFSLTLAVCLGLVLLCQLPFTVALEIHHVFAAVDHDGHEHSDFDLCQWIQQHTTGSIAMEPPRLTALIKSELNRWLHTETLFSSSLVPSSGSRAPPSFVA